MITLPHRWRQLPAEKLSSKVLGLLIALVILLFALFGLVGYNRPYDEDPNFVAPLFTDVLIVFMELLVVLAMGCAVWSMTRSLKVRGKSEAYENNVPIKKIGYVVSWGTAALLLLSFLLGSAHSMVINGVEYTDEFWLKTADMLIVSSLLLIVVAIGAMAYGATNFMRRDHVR